MKKGKYERTIPAKESCLGMKTLTVLLALMLVVGCAVGGTLAWLMDETGPVANTFTVGDVTITLKETPLVIDGTKGEPAENTANTYKLIPGTTYWKDPVVTVTDETNVDCYLFVKFEEEGNPSTYLDYESTLTVANGWTNGDGTVIPANVWHRVVSAEDAGTDKASWHLLQDDKVTVKDNIVKAGTDTKDTTFVVMPGKNAGIELKYTAYAVQKDNVDSAGDAWKLVSGS